MAYSQTQIDALKDALARGVTKVTYSDGATVRSAEYRSLAEIREILRLMEDEVAAQTSNSRSTVVEFSRE